MIGLTKEMAEADGTEGWSEAQLASLVMRDSLIGVKTADNP